MQWPDGMQPEKSRVYARNEIKISATPERVWKWLSRAGLWPTWYTNCTWLKFDDGSGPDLALNTVFTWKTFGARVHSIVRVFEPPRALEWDGRSIGLRAYHGWLIEPAVDGSWVVTEETQNGPVAKLLGWYLRPALARGHQNWVESLRRVATTG